MSLMTDLRRKIVHEIGRRRFRPTIKIEPCGPLLRLGSDYGGWTIADRPNLVGCTAISAGLGEDASFDVELAARFGASVIVVDPTPRAIDHFEALHAHIGRAATTGYVPGGAQPISAYDLSAISAEQLRIERKALWIDEHPIRFYKPADPTHVSHSIKFQAADEANFITVPTITMTQILNDLPPQSFRLLKMDIEGAEIDILETIPHWPTLPDQLLVEFDVLREPGAPSKAAVERIDAILRERGYRCGHFDGSRNYLYVLS